MVHFGEFLKTWSLRSNSVTRQVSFNRTKIGGKYQTSNIKMRHFGWFSNNVELYLKAVVSIVSLSTWLRLISKWDFFALIVKWQSRLRITCWWTTLTYWAQKRTQSRWRWNCWLCMPIGCSTRYDHAYKCNWNCSWGKSSSNLRWSCWR